ncbi:enoyl-CoA hydratase domain-containing protein 2, mitochondrial [Polypterus senegalus]|uniref:enoyl-CoA hydratase domain-containing protein 2, mitochondrial n=1 Tax=Polypterus senegalus TaxID=55291 RepID=UPI001965C0C9|nr:enoyl-CoA hydratase domain-containing protein 2, mitochondrial [Polypterus senegalus]
MASWLRVLASRTGSAVPRICSARQIHGAGEEVRLNRLQGAHQGVAEVVMNRPAARNALGTTFVNQMSSVVDGLRHDDQLRVVLFKSELQGVFCAGADLKERAQMDPSEVELFVHGLRALMSEIAQLPMPTIAAMDGYALGGGLELALACDIRTAAFSAKLGLIETSRGLLPGAGGTQRLPRTIGLSQAKELIFTGRQIDGQRAAALGLVNKAVAQNDAGDAAYREALLLASEILPQAPVAVRMAKRALTGGSQVDLVTGLAIEGMCYAQVIPTMDRLEGMAAFMQKRPPRFSGQ